MITSNFISVDDYDYYSTLLHSSASSTYVLLISSLYAVDLQRSVFSEWVHSLNRYFGK